MSRGWNPALEAQRRPGGSWLSPFAKAAPWITLVFVLMTLYVTSGALSTADGIMFELPDGDALDSSASRLAALAVPANGEILVFFDDTRYIASNPESLARFCSQLAEAAGRTGGRELLLFADGRIGFSHISAIASAAKSAGIERVLFAVRKDGGAGL